MSVRLAGPRAKLWGLHSHTEPIRLFRHCSACFRTQSNREAGFCCPPSRKKEYWTNLKSHFSGHRDWSECCLSRASPSAHISDKNRECEKDEQMKRMGLEREREKEKMLPSWYSASWNLSLHNRRALKVFPLYVGTSDNACTTNQDNT